MGQVIGAVSASGTTASYTIVDVPSPGIMGPTVVNNYTTLAVPAYVRALNFKSANMASFPRSVQKDGIEIKHRLDKILKRKPNAYQSPTMLFRTWFFHQAHYANGYVEIERDKLFNAVALHNRPPEIVAPFRYLEDDGQVSGWYWVGGYKPRIVAAADMMHLTGLSYDGMSGLNPCWIHAETFERARLMDRYITRFLVKGTIVRGSIELPAGMTDDQIDAVIAKIRQYKGADAENDLLVLSGGGKLTNNSLSNDQSQLIQLHDLSDVQIAQLTDVPPWFIFNDKNGKYNTTPAQAGEDVVKYLFRLLIEQAEDELIKLLSDVEQDAGFTVHIDPAALIRGDVAMEATIVTKLTGAGLITSNEGRQELGWPKSNDPEGDKLKQRGDTAPPKAATQAPQNQAATQAPTVEDFAALITDAAGRVETKTAKATANAQGKPADAFTIWANVFAQEQEAYAVEALKPIVATIAVMTGRDPAGTAERIGATYAHELRTHYARLVRGVASNVPDLQSIFLAAMDPPEEKKKPIGFGSEEQSRVPATRLTMGSPDQPRGPDGRWIGDDDGASAPHAPSEQDGSHAPTGKADEAMGAAMQKGAAGRDFGDPGQHPEEEAIRQHILGISPQARKAAEHDLANAQEAAAQWGAKLREQIKSGTVDPVLVAKVNSWHEAIESRQQAVTQGRAAAAWRAHELIAVPNGATVKVNGTNSAPKPLRENVDRFKRFAEQTISADAAAPTIYVKVGGWRTRAYAEPGGKIKLAPNDDAGTVAHEYGHQLEFNSPAHLKAANEFLARRTAGEQPRKLMDITGNPAYGHDEVAREDHFQNPYTGSHYPDGYTEVTSMGLERMMRDPAEFAHEDPDHFRFTMAQMRRKAGPA